MGAGGESDQSVGLAWSWLDVVAIEGGAKMAEEAVTALADTSSVDWVQRHSTGEELLYRTWTGLRPQASK